MEPGKPALDRSRQTGTESLFERLRTATARHPLLSALVITILIFVFLLLPLWWMAGAWYEDRVITEERATVTADLAVYGSRLSQALSQRGALVEGLSAFVLTDPTPGSLSRNYDTFAAGLYSSIPGIRNFGVAPGGVQTYVYPLVGNENVPGHNLLTDNRSDVQRYNQLTIESRKTVIRGPHELRQGGLGLVIQKALFINDTFWGFASTVVDMPPVLTEAGLDRQTGDLTIAIRNQDGVVFFGDPALFSNDTIIQQVPVSTGTWEIAGMPAGGWAAAAAPRTNIFFTGGLAVILLISVLIFVVAARTGSRSETPISPVFTLDPLKICLVYLAFATVWILTSDAIVLATFSHPEDIAAIQSIKGVIFIIVTALLLYLLIRHFTFGLEERRRRLELAVQSGNVGLWDWDLGTNRVKFSTEWKHQLGYEPDEITDAFSEWESRVHPDDLAGALVKVQEFIAHPETGYHSEFRMRHKDGSYRWILAQASMVTGDAATPARIIGSHIDITARKREEEVLRESEARFRTVFEQLPIALCFVNKAGELKLFNDRFIRMFGYTLEDIPTLAEWWQRAYPDENYRSYVVKTWDADVQNSAKNHVDIQPREYRVTCKDGEERFIIISGIVLGEDFLATFIDITERKRAEADIRLKNELLHMTGEMALVGGWEFDARTGHGTWTDEVARIHDLDPAAEPDVKTGLSVYSGESRNKIDAAIKDAVEHARSYDLELEMVTAKGRHRWVRTMGLPIEEDGAVTKVRGIFQDITDKKIRDLALSRQNRALHLTSSADSLLVRATDEQTLTEEICTLITEIGGYRMAWIGYAEADEQHSVHPVASSGFAEGYLDTLNITWADAERGRGPTGTAIRTGTHCIARNIPGDPAFAPWREAAIRQGYQSSIALPLEAEGTVIGALNIYSTEPDAFDEEEVRLLLQLAHDLSFGIQTLRARVLQANAEEDLRKLNVELESRVIERTRELSAANERLKELDQLKSMFIASMSHELRTPLNSIIGFTGIMKKGLAGEINPEQEKQLGIVQNSARHLLALINDVIDISKIEAGKIDPSISTFNLSTVVRDITGELLPAAAERGLTIAVRCPDTLMITSDERRVRQIIYNFVSNAVKFTDTGGITINVESDKEHVAISVQDTGIGITPEHLAQLFQAFSRVPTPGRLVDGTGLGLYLSKKLAVFLGGDVRVQSVQGKGSTFTFQLPRDTGTENHP